MGWLWAPKLTAELKESVFGLAVVFSNTETSAVPALATARSGLPSPFMSPMATDSGRLWAPKFAAVANVGVVVPGDVVLSSTETSVELKLATARSGLPSPFRSPIATEKAVLWATKFEAALHEHPPVPSSTDTSFVELLATARSGMPSAFRSPIAIDSGCGCAE